MGKPNVMVKIPGTTDGLDAIEESLSAGISVNVTLLFSVPRNREVVERYFVALERRNAAGLPIDQVASVASFFVSRIDTKVDAALDGIVAKGGERAARARSLRSRGAIANAKVAYESFRTLFRGPRWDRLAAAGARPQRLLWASTSPKDPSLPPLYYAKALVARDTVDTMTLPTFEAFEQAASVEARLESPYLGEREILADIGAVGVDLDRITRDLEAEGITQFAVSYGEALDAILRLRRRRAA